MNRVANAEWSIVEYRAFYGADWLVIETVPFTAK